MSNQPDLPSLRERPLVLELELAPRYKRRVAALFATAPSVAVMLSTTATGWNPKLFADKYTATSAKSVPKLLPAIVILSVIGDNGAVDAVIDGADASAAIVLPTTCEVDAVLTPAPIETATLMLVPLLNAAAAVAPTSTTSIGPRDRRRRWRGPPATRSPSN